MAKKTVVIAFTDGTNMKVEDVDAVSYDRDCVRVSFYEDNALHTATYLYHNFYSFVVIPKED